ncbi:MAG: Fe-S-containing protein [Ignavibacteria bacterium]|nr:Fe-S-containing protein [Ignavibacteria bacterium]
MAISCSACGKAIESSTRFCTSCGAPVSERAQSKGNRQEKRERVLGKQQSGERNRTTLITTGLVVAVIGGWVVLNLPSSGNPVLKALPVVATPAQYSRAGQQMAAIQVRIENGKVNLPLDEVKEKKFVKFTYGNAASGLPMLAYVSGEGKIVTAVSVCEPCNSNAFHIKGDKIICNSCGSTWELNTLEAVSGSCGKYPPDVVPNTIVGKDIQIDVQIVARWQRRV